MTTKGDEPMSISEEDDSSSSVQNDLSKQQDLPRPRRVKRRVKVNSKSKNVSPKDRFTKSEYEKLPLRERLRIWETYDEAKRNEITNVSHEAYLGAKFGSNKKKTLTNLDKKIGRDETIRRHKFF